MKSQQNILVLNSGSSSLKFGLFAPGSSDEELLLEGSAEEIGREEGTLAIRTADGRTLHEEQHVLETQQQALEKIAATLKQYADGIAGIGHRIVHGGPHLVEHQRITPQLLTTLEESVHFAPLHIPQALKLLQLAETIFPEAPQFACFDTAFHRTLPELAARYPLPQRYFEAGVRRYGFHGLSYESLVYRLGSTLPQRAVFAHLGNGSSLAAVREGQSVETSMGLTPTGGTVMSSRLGDIDPGVVLYLSRTEQKPAEELEQFLNHECGIKALSGGESDMQALLASESSGDAAATLAIDAFCASVRKFIGAYAASLGGLDLLVFTGGIGYHSEAIRDRICLGLEFLGVGKGSKRVQAIKTEEEVQISRHVRRLLAGA